MKLPNKEQVSNHILPTASNLLGICFVLLSFIKLNKLENATILDEAVLVPIFLLFAACIFSYLSLRSYSTYFNYEKIADAMFMISLLAMTTISVILVFEIF